jgi:hypothetical protein
MCTCFGVTTRSAIPASGTLSARDAATGATSCIDSWPRASSTVNAVVQTCSSGFPSTDSCRGRARLSTMVSDAVTD